MQVEKPTPKTPYGHTNDHIEIPGASRGAAWDTFLSPTEIAGSVDPSLLKALGISQCELQKIQAKQFERKVEITGGADSGLAA